MTAAEQHFVWNSSRIDFKAISFGMTWTRDEWWRYARHLRHHMIHVSGTHHLTRHHRILEPNRLFETDQLWNNLSTWLVTTLCTSLTSSHDSRERDTSLDTSSLDTRAESTVWNRPALEQSEHVISDDVLGVHVICTNGITCPVSLSRAQHGSEIR